MSYKNKRKYYYCKYCSKKYPTIFDAELCFNLDMQNLNKIKITKNENTNKKTGN